MEKVANCWKYSNLAVFIRKKQELHSGFGDHDVGICLCLQGRVVCCLDFAFFEVKQVAGSLSYQFC